MRRFLVFLSTFLFCLPFVFSQDVDSLSASISLFPSHEKTAEANSSDVLKKLKQKQLEILSTISIERQRPLNEDDVTAEQKREDFLKQKQSELTEINLDIERLQALRSHQIGNTIQQFSWYLLVFIFIYFLRVVSRSFLSRFAR